MEQRRRIKFGLIIITAVLVIAVMVLCFRKEGAPIVVDEAARGESGRGETDVSTDMNAQLFYDAVARYPAPAGSEGAAYAGGIISHHDLASEVIAEFFSRLAQDEHIDTFILIGPNHDNVGLSPVISGRVRWQTPLGAVETDYDILDDLTTSGLVSLDEENLRRDNAVTTLLPFIEYYFPDARIVPLLFTSEETMKKDMLLASAIKGVSGEKTFLLASLDFSHYLDRWTADEKDDETLAALRDRDYETIAAWNSDHVDSHWTLINLLRVMELETAEEPEILRHTNSADFMGQGSGNTTSYFSILYSR